MEMDSDFSHDPAYIPQLLRAVETADLAIGSRYVPGGGVTEWGSVRRFISRGGSRYARSVLGVRVRDLTGGFKVFRREVLEAIDLDDVASLGYAFQVEMTYRAIKAGFTVVEVPIVFRDRTEGSSKMSKAIVAEAIWRVPAMRMRRRPAALSRAMLRLRQPSRAGVDRPRFILYSECRLQAFKNDNEETKVPGKLTDVTDANFQSDVLDSEKPVLVDFWAPWCGPCRVVHPVLEEMDEERDDISIVSLNVDDNQQTAAKYEVLSIPTMILFKDGEAAKRIVGAMPKGRIESELEPALAT